MRRRVQADGRPPEVCPKTARPLGPKPKGRWALLLFPMTGLAALVWFLVRVIPKPSRATYPCQKVAFPIASSFLAWVLGLGGCVVAFRKARQRIREARHLVAAVCILAGLGAAFVAVGNQPALLAGAWTFANDPYGANNPVGIARGIFPGRVVWVHDPDATDAPQTPGYFFTSAPDYFWLDVHNDQAVIDSMMSRGVRWLAGAGTDAAAWDALFRDCNQRRGEGDRGYESGEMIAIKGNLNEQRAHVDADNSGDLSPHLVLALLRQLVNQAGVPQDKIVFFDTSRLIADKTYTECHAEFPNVIYMETNYYKPEGGTAGREAAVKDVAHADAVIHYSGGYSQTEVGSHRISTRHRDADYFINLAILKKHQDVGSSCIGKNTFGCLCEAPTGLHKDLPNVGHSGNPAVGQYGWPRPMVDHMGHPHMGGKALIYIVDALWGAWHSGGVPKSTPDVMNIPPFDDGTTKDYPSSLFFSLDPAAIDSVVFDFVRCEEEAYKALYGKPRGSVGDGYIKEAADDYLHEAAQAGGHVPPGGVYSGTVYDPDGDAVGIDSLGAHEHWNDVLNKQYTRNLGTGDGIELSTGPGDTDLDGDVDATDLATLGMNWAPSATDKGRAHGDFDGDGDVDATDLAALGMNWNPSGGGAAPAAVGEGAVVGGAGDAPRLVATSPAPGSATAGMRRIVLTFDRAVCLGGGAIEVHGRAGGAQSGYAVTVVGTGETVAVTWPAPLAADVYEVRVMADAVLGAGGGAALDGEVGDPADPSSLPSGDGVPGGDARLEFEAK